MQTLVLLRHGESDWNKENRFTGWTDIDLSLKGRQEASEAGRTLHQEGFTFDVAYTSVLKRAIRTLWIVLDEMDLMWIPVHKCWRLNERHYGTLQGLNKSETALKFGPEQVQAWRRSYDVAPPKLDPEDQRFPKHDRRYARVRPDQLPLSESLRDTASRLWPCWQHSVAAALREHQRVLIVAHGNSLRALVKYLDDIPDSDVAGLEIPTGIPLVYDLAPDLNPTRRYYLLSREEPESANLTFASQVPG